VSKLRLSPDLAIPEEAVTQTFAILAKRGVGKTYTAAVMAEEMLRAGLQVVIVDPIGVWWGLRAAANGKDPGLPIVVMGGDHGDVPLEATAGKVVAEFVVDTKQSVVLDLALLRKGDQTRFVTDFGESVYHRNRTPLHLVLDEADAFAPQRPMHGQERMLGAVEDLVRRGRARGIGVTLVTQRAAVLNKDVLTQAEVLVTLRTIAPQDRDAIDAWIKVHGTPQQREALMASLPSLPIGTAWFWSPGWLDIFQRVRVRPRETFDSSATPKAGARPAAPKRLADVDLEQLKTRIAATIEKAKAEDPRELRRRIAELEAALRTRRVSPAKTQRVEIPVLRDAQVKRLEAAALRFGTTGDKLVELGQAASRAAMDLAAALRQRRDEQPAPPSRAAIVRAQQAGASAERILARPTAVMVSRPTALFSNGGISGTERKILVAIAQHGERGATREQVSVLTGYKRSTRDRYIQYLVSKGLVKVADGTIVATGAGRDVLGPDFEPLPTGAALRDYWLANLPGTERRLFEVLVAAYPNAVAREALTEATGYARSTRDRYVLYLKARKLVVDDGPGHVRAAEALFS
jgi:hypothetical protein